MIDQFKEVISEFDRVNESQNLKIKNVIDTTLRFDEIMLSKASKISLQQLEKSLDEYISKDEYVSIEWNLKATSDDFSNHLNGLDAKIQKLQDHIKQTFQNSMSTLSREVKTKIMEDWSSIPISKNQIKALIDLKSEVLCKWLHLPN